MTGIGERERAGGSAGGSGRSSASTGPSATTGPSASAGSSVSADDVAAAAERLAPHLDPTPLRPSPWLGDALGAEVRLKLETVQPTGSFKVRGALHRLLREADRGEGPLRAVAASTGNHGAAFAHALGIVGGEGTVFVPATASPAKVARLGALGVEVREAGQDCVEAEAAARRFAAQTDAVYVSPYNDAAVVAGQGTVAVEIERQWPQVDTVVVALGGGGLVGGIATWCRRRDRPGGPAEVVAASPRNSKVMIESVRRGELLDLPSEPTLSDGTAGGVEPGSLTFDLVRRRVQRLVEVDEERIGAVLVECLRREHLLVEGAAAVAIAAALDASPGELAGRRIAVVLCGANLDPDLLPGLLAAHPAGGGHEGR